MEYIPEKKFLIYSAVDGFIHKYNLVKMKYDNT